MAKVNIENVRGKLKIGIAGCGKMGVHHARVVRQMKEAELVCVSDPFIDSTRLDPEIYRNVAFFDSVDKMLNQSQLDVIHICTPLETHLDLAEKAIKSGVNAYVEKPFALNHKNAESLFKRADKKNVKICAGHQLLFEKACQETKKILHYIGDIIHIESYFSFRQVRKNIGPVDQVVDILPHPVYSLLEFLNKNACSESKNPVEIKSIQVTNNGDVRSLLKRDGVTGTLVVTLKGRPVESYLHIVGVNGSLWVDFVRETVTKFTGPGTSAIDAVLNPYLQAKQLLLNTTKAFASRAFSKQKSYPGLYELVKVFYKSVSNGSTSPLTDASILDTVRVCETITSELKKAESKFNRQAEKAYLDTRAKNVTQQTNKGAVLITGGTGFLGRELSQVLIAEGWRVRVVTRHVPQFADRLLGVEYVGGDLGVKIDENIFKEVDFVVHCAAETAGKKEDHQRNTIDATLNVLNAAQNANVKNIIHISSISVLKPGKNSSSALSEHSPVDFDNINRGPYVWAKAASEKLVTQASNEKAMDARIIRLGPLVDFKAFQAPGRLGREIGGRFFAVGSRKSTISLCDVNTAAQVVRYYLSNYDSSPPVLNLVEPNPPQRIELTRRLLKTRPDLKATWIPFGIVRVLSVFLKAGLRLVFPKKKPVDLYAAFSSETYDPHLAQSVVDKAKKTI